MKVVVAIDSFKGSMTSMQAGNACKEGILAAARAHCDGGAAAVRDRKPAADNMDVVVKPLADGGEGTVEALVEGMNGTYEYVTVTDPMGSHVKARYGILPDQTAVMEMAEASGITLVKEPLNPDIILRHHPWASVGYHHGEPESVENDSLGDRVTARPR